MMPNPPPDDPDTARKRRSLAIALALFGFVALVFLVSLVRLQGHVFDRPF